MARLAQCKQAGQVQPGVKMYKNGGSACVDEGMKAKMYKKGGKVCADNEGQEKTELKQAKALQSKAKMGKKSGGLMKGCK